MTPDWSIDPADQWDADDDDISAVVTRSIAFAARNLQDHLEAVETAAAHLDDVVSELGMSERASHHVAVITGLPLETVVRMMNGERLLQILRPLGPGGPVGPEPRDADLIDDESRHSRPDAASA
jgi:hypothetical protein